MDSDVQAYVDAIDPGRRPLFDRIHALLLSVDPGVTVRLAYKLPTYTLGDHSLHVGAWKHGLSFYGWVSERSGGFAERHPDLAGARGTLKLPVKAAAGIDDDELRAFFRATLGA